MPNKTEALKKGPKPERDPLVSITRRTDIPLWLGILIRAGAILIALILCGFATKLVTGNDPISVYIKMFEGAFGTANKTWFTFHELAILLGISLAVTPAFRMKFWNIGAEGQVLIGGLAAAVCMVAFSGSSISDGLLIVIMLISSIFAGVIWGVLPAACKAIWKTNETLFTLLMNYIAMYLIDFFIEKADPSGSHTVDSNTLVRGWLPEIAGQKYLLDILLVALLTVIMFVYLNYSKHGYEISVVGESENTARYVGINVKKVIIRTMAVSGAICGIIGFLVVSGVSHSIDKNFVQGRGFTAIMVSWLAKFNPFMMVAAAFLLVFLERGSDAITTAFDMNASFSDILTGIILFFIIGCEFFINYKLRFRSKAKKEAE